MIQEGMALFKLPQGLVISKSDCRSSKELEELLASEVGEGWDANTELTKKFKKSLVV